MFKFGINIAATLLLAAALILSGCGGGTNDHPGSISGKFSEAGGKLKANKATLIIPPNSVTVTDDGKTEQSGDERGRGLITYFTLTESTYSPAFFVEGSVYELNAVSIFEAQITSPLTFKLEYNEFLIPEGYAPTDLVIATYDNVTQRTTELASTVNLDEQMIEAPIMATGIFFLKPKSFTGELPSAGSTLTYRAQSGVNLTGFNPAVPPWTVKNFDLPFTFQISYKQPLTGMPLVDSFPMTEMAIQYDASAVLENTFFGDDLPAFQDNLWPLNGIFAYLRQTGEGVEVLGDLLVTATVDNGDGTTSEVIGTISMQNYPALRFTRENYPTLASLVSEGAIVTSAGNKFARVYRYDYLPNSPDGWTSWTWYDEIDGKNVPVAAIISRNADQDGNLIPQLSRCTVFDLATPVIF
jgi:hypothetical protein